MARTTRNLPANGDNTPANGETPKQVMTDDERLAKARAARSAAIPADERALIDTVADLRKQRDDTTDDNAKAELTKRIAAVEQQRKSMAFMRKLADATIEAETLAGHITSLAGSNYFATPEQRGKAKTLLATILSAALDEFDRKVTVREEPLTKAEKRQIERARIAAMMSR